MLDTSYTPCVVKCDGCGKVIQFCGSMCEDEQGERTLHFCDDCGSPANQEFRICTRCGMPMIDGMTDLEGFYTHSECFEAEMNHLHGEGFWHVTEDEGENGGYYVAYDPHLEQFFDTGIFYTEWY